MCKDEGKSQRERELLLNEQCGDKKCCESDADKRKKVQAVLHADISIITTHECL